MTMHLLRKPSASNSDTLEKYKISKLGRTFPVVILTCRTRKLRLATPFLCDRACKSAERLEPTKLNTPFCTLSSRSSVWDFGAPPQIWDQLNSIHGPNGSFVKIQDGFTSQETLGHRKGLYTWLPVHRSSKGQAQQTKTRLFW